MLTQAYMPVERVMAYYGNKSNPIAHFPLNFALISTSQENVSAQSIHSAIRTSMDNLPERAWPSWMVSSFLFP